MPASRLLLILGDQLSHDYLDALNADPARDRVLMAESADFLRRRPYHAKKVTLVWAAMRHFADEARERGFRVTYARIDDPAYAGRRYRAIVAEEAKEMPGGVALVTPRERTTRDGLVRLLETESIPFHFAPDPYWYTPPADFAAWLDEHPRPKMEDYYRGVRRREQVLVDQAGRPEGGQWNYDKENRKPFPKGHTPVAPFSVPPDAVTAEIIANVRGLSGLSGSPDGFALPVTRADALRALDHFVRELLPRFGPYEDAMSEQDPYGYHSLLSPLLNLSLLSPRECVETAVAAYRDGNAPLASVEGFVRQILGWREYMFHMFEAFPGDYHAVNALGHTRPLPDFYWTGETGMNCLRRVIGRVLENGYSHHIERLMVLGNFALLWGADPHELNHWFWSLYLDAYEWVVTPNTVGMASFADGGWVATKPYIASGAYVSRMSDYCKICVHDPKQAAGENACPFTTLYWAFLIEREGEPLLSGRMAQNYFGLRGKGEDERAAILERKHLLLTMAESL